jgi:hypothetical protein
VTTSTDKRSLTSAANGTKGGRPRLNPFREYPADQQTCSGYTCGELAAALDLTFAAESGARGYSGPTVDPVTVGGWYELANHPGAFTWACAKGVVGKPRIGLPTVVEREAQVLLESASKGWL